MNAPAPMRLGYLVPDWPGQTHAFFWREVSALRMGGHRVTLFSTRRQPDDACLHAFAPYARRETVYLHPPRLAPAVFALPGAGAAIAAYLAGLEDSDAWAKLRVAALVPAAAMLAARARRDGITHVHGHSCANSAHLLAMAARIGGFGYSLTLHGDLPVYGADHRSKMADARFVAAVTRPLQQQLFALDLPAHRVPLIWMGVDTDKFAPQGSSPGATGRLNLTTVARLNPAKGHRFGLDAVARACAAGVDVHYTIAGEGPEREAIAATADALGLSNRVTFTGSLGEDAILALLCRSDAFLLPSFGLGEAAPVSVMEAMAVGLPVVCSRIGGVADMIAHGEEGLLVEQRDAAGLARAIIDLALDPALRARMGAAARRQAERAFDYRATAARLLDAMAASPHAEKSPRVPAHAQPAEGRI